MNQTVEKRLDGASVGDWIRNNTNLLLMFALIIVGALTSDNFFSMDNILNVLRRITVNGMLAVACTMTLLVVNVCAAWRFNQLIFENITLREIANQLSAKYNVSVNIESLKLAQRKFRCVINEDEHLSDVLEQLCYLAPITYRIENSEIYIFEKQTKK